VYLFAGLEGAREAGNLRHHAGAGGQAGLDLNAVTEKHLAQHRGRERGHGTGRSAARNMKGLRADADPIQPVHGPKEGSHKARAGLEVSLFRRADLLDAALVQHRNPVGEREGFFLIVADEQKSDAHAALEVFELGAHLLAQTRVQCGERLVQQQHVRLDDQRARQGHPLLLAAGEFRGNARFFSGQLEQLERLTHAAGDVRNPFAPQAELDVALHGQVGKQRVVLENSA
jgi:hypothetical protein